MQAKLTNLEMINAIRAISELLELDMSIQVSWNITKNLKKLEAALKPFGLCEQNLLLKYASKDPDGNPIVENNQYYMNDASKEKFMRDKAELLNLANEVDILTINLTDLGSNNTKIKPSILLNLFFMLNEDEV